MVLQLCGRVCRRLSFKNPHHLVDEDFLFRKYCNYVGAPIAIGGRRLSFENLASNETGFFVLQKYCSFIVNSGDYWVVS
jgi:hypothetical protein